MTVVDYCAGAGGKTLALAAAMTRDGRLDGRLAACDVAGGRLGRMEDRLKRAQVMGVECRLIEEAGDTCWRSRPRRPTVCFSTCRAPAPAPGGGIPMPVGGSRRTTSRPSAGASAACWTTPGAWSSRAGARLRHLFRPRRGKRAAGRRLPRRPPRLRRPRLRRVMAPNPWCPLPRGRAVPQAQSGGDGNRRIFLRRPGTTRLRPLARVPTMGMVAHPRPRFRRTP